MTGRDAIKTPPQHGEWGDFLDTWRAADDIEVFESAWTMDHFYPLTPPMDGTHLESWTMLAALAQATKRLRLVAMVNGCEPKALQDPRPPIVIGGRGPRRTLRTVARWADQWDMTFPDSPEHWRTLDEVLRGHCAELGRDPASITRSIHLGYPADADPAALVAQAPAFFDAGVDVIVWSMRGPYTPALVEPLALALTNA